MSSSDENIQRRRSFGVRVRPHTGEASEARLSQSKQGGVKRISEHTELRALLAPEIASRFKVTINAKPSIVTEEEAKASRCEYKQASFKDILLVCDLDLVVDPTARARKFDDILDGIVNIANEAKDSRRLVELLKVLGLDEVEKARALDAFAKQVEAYQVNPVAYKAAIAAVKAAITHDRSPNP